MGIKDNLRQAQLEILHKISEHEVQSDSAILFFQAKDEDLLHVDVLDKLTGDFYQFREGEVPEIGFPDFKLYKNNVEMADIGTIIPKCPSFDSEKAEFEELDLRKHAEICQKIVQKSIPCCGENMSKIIGGLMADRDHHPEDFEQLESEIMDKRLNRALHYAGLSIGRDGYIYETKNIISSAKEYE